VKQAAGEVARECRPALATHAGPKIASMTAAQSRGYLCALAPGFVAREVDAVLGRRRISLSLRARVAAEAVKQVVELVVNDLIQFQPVLGATSLGKAA
jgi:hypothetical protein